MLSRIYFILIYKGTNSLLGNEFIPVNSMNAGIELNHTFITVWNLFGFIVLQRIGLYPDYLEYIWTDFLVHGADSFMECAILGIKSTHYLSVHQINIHKYFG